MNITEPMTLATDYLMGAIALVLALRAYRRGALESVVSMRLWGIALAMTAIASFLGGSYHGFLTMMSPSAAAHLWTATLAATGLGSAALLAAAAVAATRGGAKSLVLVLVVAKLAAYLFWISTRAEFIIVIIDYTSALAGVLLLAWFAVRGGLRAAAPMLTAGVALSVGAALIQALRLAPHPQFNHNDLFHVVQTVAIYVLYRAGLLMRDAR